MKRAVWSAGVGFALSLVVAPAAIAADTFVDSAIGSDGNSCTSTGAACATIGAAIGKAGGGDTIRVGPGIYTEQLALGNGKSLRATGTAASTIIDSATAPTVDVATAAGTIEGFTIRGQGSDSTGVLRLQAPATVRGNVFDSDETTPPPPASLRPVDLRITAGAGSPTVTENTFTDNGEDTQFAIATVSTGSPTISDNRISGFFEGIEVTGGTPEISRNVITGTHNFAGAGQGASIAVYTGPANVAPTLTANFIHDPVTNGDGTPNGMAILDFLSGGAGDTFVGATLRRNRILGGFFGIDLFGTLLPVTLNSDLISGATGLGLSASETAAGSGDVTATNATVFGNAFDIRITGTQLTLNSSIVGDPISALGTSPSCAITFSRLSPTATPTVPSCDDAATTVDPLFVNDDLDAGPDNYHLQSSSTMRNAGDPAAPPPGTLDFDGDPRQSGSCLPGAIQRDIGADETKGGGCGSPETQIDSGPAPGSSTSGSPIAEFPAPTFGFSSPAFSPTFECSLDDGAFSSCTSTKSYVGLGAGGHTFAVRARDGTETADDTPATRVFTVDGTPPETQIDSGPDAGATSGPSPSFGFSSEPGASFECSLDGGGFAACGSPHQLTGLSNGEHRLVVRSIDGVGNADPTAASRSWNVDATAPETQIDSGPTDGSTIGVRTATYGFSADEAATFECSADGAAFSSCASPFTLSNLTVGPHSFAVRATDSVGNVDQSPATRSLTVPRGAGDTDPPNTKIRKVTFTGDDAKIKFSSNEPGSTFQCKLDKKRFKGCRSPRKVKNLDDGKHKFKVRAIDPAGNVDPSPAKRRFEID